MIVPFLIIYLFNWVVFFIIIVSLVHKAFQPHIKDIRSKKDNICQQLIIAVTLSVLFGLGWGIGLLATQDIYTNKTVRDLFAASFVIITAFHGLFIFIMQCLRSNEVRNAWKQWFFSITGKDVHEIALSTSSNKHHKRHAGVSSSGATSGTAVPIHGCNDSTLEKDGGNLQFNVEKESECLPSSTIALDNMEIGKEIEMEGNVPVETSFTKDDEVDEKKILQREEEEQYQS